MLRASCDRSPHLSLHGRRLQTDDDLMPGRYLHSPARPSDTCSAHARPPGFWTHSPLRQSSLSTGDNIGAHAHLGELGGLAQILDRTRREPAPYLHHDARSSAVRTVVPRSPLSGAHPCAVHKSGSRDLCTRRNLRTAYTYWSLRRCMCYLQRPRTPVGLHKTLRWRRAAPAGMPKEAVRLANW